MDDTRTAADHAAACTEMMADVSGMPMMGMMGMGMGDTMGMGFPMLLMLLSWVLVLIVLVLVAVALVRWLVRPRGAGQTATRVEQELGLRYVRGEIDRETYLRLREEVATSR